MILWKMKKIICTVNRFHQIINISNVVLHKCYYDRAVIFPTFSEIVTRQAVRNQSVLIFLL